MLPKILTVFLFWFVECYAKEGVVLLETFQTSQHNVFTVLFVQDQDAYICIHFVIIYTDHN